MGEVVQIFQIEDDRALIAIERSKILGLTFIQGRPLTHAITLASFDFDDVSSHIRQKQSREGPCCYLPELDDANA
jgi:hypothetical protein